MPLRAFGPETQTGAGSSDQLWRKTIDLVQDGDFTEAAAAAKRLESAGPIVNRVRTWLEEYQSQQDERRALNREDFEKYVGYAQARIDRKEFDQALSWTLRALDCAPQREEFLKSAWIQQLANDSLDAARALREESKWREAWHIYSLLSGVFEKETGYQKLEREALTHLRLDAMFEDDRPWKEMVERVRWQDAEQALEYIHYYYVEPADFRGVAEGGLEQLLLLTESKTAQKSFDGLRNEVDLRDFRLRVREHLDQVKAAPSVDYKACKEHFRRVVEINRQTVRLPDELLVSELMRGALEPLDEFTTIIWPQESKEFEKHTRGDFIGVGISIIKNRADEVEVVSPLEDTPAYRAGIQAGDIIVGVDSRRLDKNVSINGVVDIITGKAGTAVTLTIRRDQEEIEFPLVRNRVKIRSVKGVRRDPQHEEDWDHWLDKEMGVGYVRVVNFQSNTVEDLANILSELSADGLKGVVLDLRGNPGGLLDAAWKLSSLFLKRGDTVVSTKGRIKHEDQSFDTTGDGAFSDIPLVVLVDERSASASEIVSGAVRDNGRGVVIGERTFGKFSVQNLIPLSRSGAKLKITTAKYYLPSGDSLHRDPGAAQWGVEPDIATRLVAKEAQNVYTLWREASLLGPVKPKKEGTPSDVDPLDPGGEDDVILPEAPAGPTGDAAKSAEGKDGTSAEGDKDAGEKNTDAKSDESSEEKTADADKKDELPELEQPDENNRKKTDPQLDTALLLMRITLLGKSYPTLAAIEHAEPTRAANP
jgi:carboxyl-terminal processing protease